MLARLNEGEDFATVAAEVSLDTSNSTSGGDLGWFSQGRWLNPLKSQLTRLKSVRSAKPVQSDFGYHVIQLLGKEMRDLSDEQWDAMKQQAFADFIEEAKAGMEIKKFDVWASVAPSTPTIPAEYRIAATQ